MFELNLYTLFSLHDVLPEIIKMLRNKCIMNTLQI